MNDEYQMHDEETKRRSKGNLINRNKVSYVYMSRTPSYEDQNQFSSLNSSRNISPSPGLLADYHGSNVGMMKVGGGGAKGSGSLTNSRRTSFQSNNNEQVSPLEENKRRVRKRDKMFEFAKLKNPTLSIRISKEYCFDFTYAELLQFSTILITFKKVVGFYWPYFDHHHQQNPSHQSSIDQSMPTPTIIYLNLIILLIASASIEGRKKAEQLGLRRTCLMLCTLLFLIGCIVALWPVRLEGVINQDEIVSKKVESRLTTFEWVKEESKKEEIQHCYENLNAIDCEQSSVTISQEEIATFDSISQSQCASTSNPSKRPSFIQIHTDQDNSIIIVCNPLDKS